jgi:hypothetical protein
MDKLAKKIEAYYLHKGWYIDYTPDAANIAYIEGANEDGSSNADKPNEWNDRRIVFSYGASGEEPYIVLNTAATTEPGLLATNTKAAQKLGGVARIQFGQFKVWKMGYHKGNPLHPALVQSGGLMVYADLNKDGKRTGDKLRSAIGINQHGTSKNAKPQKVGNWSAGCLVGMNWVMHLNFIKMCREDPAFIRDNNYLFHTSIINGDEFAKFNY